MVGPRNVVIHDILYQEHNERLQRKKEAAEAKLAKFRFQPSIERISEPFGARKAPTQMSTASAAGGASSDTDSESHELDPKAEQRRREYLQRKEHKKKMLEDSATGFYKVNDDGSHEYQPYFTPQITRPPLPLVMISIIFIIH
jgi:hypothetical protein